jgi:hypothetical protein
VIDVQDDGSLYGEINHPTKQAVVGYVKVWRSDDRSLVVAIPKQALARRLSVYRWNFSSLFHDDNVTECSNDGEGHTISCVDTIPNQGWIVHRL